MSFLERIMPANQGFTVFVKNQGEGHMSFIKAALGSFFAASVHDSLNMFILCCNEYIK